MKKWPIHVLALLLILFVAACAVAQDNLVVSETLSPEVSPDLQDFRARIESSYPGMDVVSVAGSVVAVVAPRPVFERDATARPLVFSRPSATSRLGPARR